GLLGAVVALVSTAVPTWIAHLTPWGYYALSAAAGYVDGQLAGFAPSYLSVVGLAVVAAAVFALLTRSFDRQEAWDERPRCRVLEAQALTELGRRRPVAHRAGGHRIDHDPHRRPRPRGRLAHAVDALGRLLRTLPTPGGHRDPRLAGLACRAPRQQLERADGRADAVAADRLRQGRRDLRPGRDHAGHRRGHRGGAGKARLRTARLPTAGVPRRLPGHHPRRCSRRRPPVLAVDADALLRRTGRRRVPRGRV